MSKNQIDYTPGDKIFAKVKGFPHWPARVNQLPPDVPTPKGKFPIFFYGTHEVYFLTKKDMYPYEHNKAKFGTPKVRAHFNTGLEEIENNDKVLFYGVDPRAESFLSRFYKFVRTDGGEDDESTDAHEEEAGEKASLSGSAVSLPSKKTPRKRQSSSNAGRKESKAKRVKSDHPAPSSEDENETGQSTESSASEEPSSQSEASSDSDSDNNRSAKKKRVSQGSKNRRKHKSGTEESITSASSVNNVRNAVVSLTRITPNDTKAGEKKSKSAPSRKRPTPAKKATPKSKAAAHKTADSDDSLSSLSSDSDSDSDKKESNWRKQDEERKREMENKLKEYEKLKEKREHDAVKKASKELKASRKSSGGAAGDESTAQSSPDTKPSPPISRKISATGEHAKAKATPTNRRPIRASVKNFSATRLVAEGNFPEDEDSEDDSDFDASKAAKGAGSSGSSSDVEVDQRQKKSKNEEAVKLKLKVKPSPGAKRRLLGPTSSSESENEGMKEDVESTVKSPAKQIVLNSSGDDSDSSKDRRTKNENTVPISSSKRPSTDKKSSDQQSKTVKFKVADQKRRILPSSSSDEGERIEKIKEKKKQEKLEQKKRGKLQEMTMEAKLRLMNREIKASLVRGQEDYPNCLAQLETLSKMEIRLAVLVKCWELMDTIRKCRRYKQSEDVKLGAQKVFNKFLEIYASADKDEVVRAQVEFMKHQTQHQPTDKTHAPTIGGTMHDLFTGVAQTPTATPLSTAAPSLLTPAPTAVPKPPTPPVPTSVVDAAVVPPLAKPPTPPGTMINTPPHTMSSPSRQNGAGGGVNNNGAAFDDILTTIPGFELAKTSLGLMSGGEDTSQPSLSHLLPSNQSHHTAEPVSTSWPANPVPLTNRNRTVSDSDPTSFLVSTEDFEVLDTYESNSDDAGDSPVKQHQQLNNQQQQHGPFSSLDLDSRIAQLMQGGSSMFPTAPPTASASNSSSAPTANHRSSSHHHQSSSRPPHPRQHSRGPRGSGDGEDDEIYNLLGV